MKYYRIENLNPSTIKCSFFSSRKKAVNHHSPPPGENRTFGVTLQYCPLLKGLLASPGVYQLTILPPIFGSP
jgi:hypothetical protein